MAKKELLVLLVLALIAGCGSQEKKEQAKVFDLSQQVATVDDTAFTLADLNRQLDRMGWVEHTGLKRIGDTAQFNFNALDELIQEKLVSDAADTFSIDTVLDAQSRIREHMRSYAMHVMYNDVVAANVEVTPEEVEAYYDTNKGDFYSPPAANVSQILISVNPGFYVPEGHSYSEISKDSVDVLARQKMEEVIEKLKDGESFEDLAKEYSHDQNSGQKGGSLGWIERDQSPPEFDSVAFAVPIGEVSPAIHTQYGYHLIKVSDRKEGGYTPLDDQLRANITQKLMVDKHRELSRAFMDSLRKVTKVTYNERLLKKNDSTYTPKQWLVTINGLDTIYVYEYSNYARTYRMKNRLPELTVDQKKEVLDGFVSVHTLGVEAKKRGYYDTPEAAQELADFSHEQAKHQYRLRGEAPVWEPTDEEAKAFYDAHKQDYYSNRPLKVQHILFQDSLKADKVRREIENGADFKEMALKYYPGEEAIRESLFDLGWISKDEMPLKFWNAAWLLSVGDVSRPVKTEYGYHLIKLLDRKEMKDFDQAKALVKRRMKDERREEYKSRWEKELYTGHTVDIDSALVREFVYQTPPAAPTTPVDSAQVSASAPAPAADSVN
jgi:parvulin-like peptidyl-prolyl isomerase